MKEYKVKSGQEELILRKSSRLVGLKTKDEQKADAVDADVLPSLGGFEVVTLKDKNNIDDALDEARSADEVEVGTHVYFAKGDNRPVVPTGILYITFASGVGEGEGQVVLDAYGLELLERQEGNIVVASVTANSPNPLKVAQLMENLSMVDEVTPDLDVPLDQYALVMPRDSLLTQQWHLDNNGFIPDVPNFRLKPGADAKIKDAWERLGNLGSRSITVAVIDNGFDLNHPDLRGKVVAPLNISNGSNQLPSGSRFGNHATPCASVAVASANGSGIVGVAPNARLMPLHGLTFSAWLTDRMFNHCIRNKADVISCSWGTIQSQFKPNAQHKLAISRTLRDGRNGKGCVIVFAAGNEGASYLNYYSSLPGVIAVGSSTSSDTHPRYSNRGPQLSVVAPSDGGWPILAARASWDAGSPGVQPHLRFYADGRDRGPHYKHFGGTSSATPLVAGICALILSANPNLTAAQVKSILERTADKIGSRNEYDSRGHSQRFGYGRVNADRAVAEALRMRAGGTATGNTGTSQPSGGSTPSPQPVPQPQPAPQPTPSPTPAPQPAPSPPTGGGISMAAGKGLYRFSVKGQPNSGWGAQIGSFGDFGNVLIQAEKAERLFGVPVVVHVVENGSRTTFRVVVGNFSNKSQADALVSKMKRFGYAPFAKNLATLR